VNKIKRNPRAAGTSRDFLLSLFSEPGCTIPSADIAVRAMHAKIAASPSSLINAAQVLVKDGFLEQPQRGFYRRPEVKGTPLPLAEAPIPSAEVVDAVRLAGISQQIRSLEDSLSARFSALAHLVTDPALGLDADDLGHCHSLAKARAVLFAQGGNPESANAFHALAARLLQAQIVVARNTGAPVPVLPPSSARLLLESAGS